MHAHRPENREQEERDPGACSAQPGRCVLVQQYKWPNNSQVSTRFIFVLYHWFRQIRVREL